MQSVYETDATSAAVAGFDHFSAVFTWFGVAGGLLPWLVVPAFFAMPWLTALSWTAATLLVLSILVLPFRFRISITPTEIVFERSWAAVWYKRVEIPNNSETRFVVNGTGDWNDEGMWPGKHYCEVVSPGTSELMFGTPGKAEQLAAWLASNAQRVARSDAQPFIAADPGRLRRPVG
ncbi:hypothetical protein HZ993_06685 [Rhodoferax sp. AJA081-3]|uniref:hypothetical protein n=1 Tax=Rhodoferax sp. AJA081-3 TaxID=2752316 RepID=UPI001AE000DB|nr:hypothetical protein [Rhodoferax sp. AJA081-3]QTN29499.1 hypothetical protein HZ993_06685 [Rhodoferax sp. AJA081-3]